MEWKHLPIVSSSFDEKIDEIQQHLNLLQLLLQKDVVIRCNSYQNTSEKKLTPNDTHSFKASAVLMIYNFIESICTALMDDIYNHIQKTSHSNRFFSKKKQLNPELKTHIVNYLENKALLKGFVYSHDDKHLDKKLLILWINSFLNTLTEQSSDGQKYHKWFSGNVDFKEIKKELAIYGIRKDEIEKINKPSGKNSGRASSLKTVKDARNTLAHGGKSFSRFGQDISYEEIEKHFKNIKNLLEKLFEKVNEHLENLAYLIDSTPQPRPV